MSSADAEDIRDATRDITSAARRMANKIDALEDANDRAAALIEELEAQHVDDDRELALMEARSATEREIAENVRQQLIWTQKELDAAQGIMKNLEIGYKDELESAQRRANAKENAMHGQLSAMQEEIARLKNASAV